PSDCYILLHQEMAYLPSNPRMVGFYCHTPPAAGSGHTIICDMRGVLEALPDHLRQRLIDEGVRYGRNLRDESVQDWRADPIYGHATWQYWFDSHDRDEVAAKLAERGLSHRWESDGGLSFWSTQPGITNHPTTGQRLFFNQIYAQQYHEVGIGKER